ncbi:dUTP pyrophosphatase [Clostridium botulinum]|nr:dUTP pyrophosphatase [Clostridium botulinum]
MIKDIKNDNLYFARVRENAIIPSKEDENGGYDIYSCFEEDFIAILPHKTVMIPTGIASACSDDYTIILKERGSTGSKGIGQRCGVVDSGYRGEWFVPLTNTTDDIICISKLNEEDTDLKICNFGKYKRTPIEGKVIVYPYKKAICQALVVPVPKMKVNEISYEQLKEFKSNRGDGKLGSSKK